MGGRAKFRGSKIEQVIKYYQEKTVKFHEISPLFILVLIPGFLGGGVPFSCHMGGFPKMRSKNGAHRDLELEYEAQFS